MAKRRNKIVIYEVWMQAGPEWFYCDTLTSLKKAQILSRHIAKESGARTEIRRIVIKSPPTTR